jgi:hypothetical protein
MDYYLVNTEAKEFDGRSPHKEWLRHERAFVSGIAGKSDRKFACKLQQLQQGDVVFMYANKTGVVAVGTVRHPCDGKHSEPPRLYNRPQDCRLKVREYAAEVDWLAFVETPIRPADLYRRIKVRCARQAIQCIRDRTAAERLHQYARQQAIRE